jgi:hypothetical protein
MRIQEDEVTAPTPSSSSKIAPAPDLAMETLQLSERLCERGSSDQPLAMTKATRRADELDTAR